MSGSPIAPSQIQKPLPYATTGISLSSGSPNVLIANAKTAIAEGHADQTNRVGRSMMSWTRAVARAAFDHHAMNQKIIGEVNKLGITNHWNSSGTKNMVQPSYQRSATPSANCMPKAGKNNDAIQNVSVNAAAIHGATWLFSTLTFQPLLAEK